MFGKRLAELRNKRELSQYKLAEFLNLTRGQIGNYEQGKRQPDFDTLRLIADFFDVSTDYLLGRTDDPTSPNLNKIEPDYDALVFGQAKTFPQAVEISTNVWKEYNLSKKWLHEIWAKAAKILPMEDTDIMEEPAHGPRHPASGLSDPSGGDGD